MSARSLVALSLGLGLYAAASTAEATPTCTAPSRLMQFPAVNPLWEFCFRTPVTSTSQTGNGSGLEIHDVYYNNHLVFKRAHAPILNVLYLTGCGCFRDWSDEEVKFKVLDDAGQIIHNPSNGQFVETNFPAVTVCDTGSGVDVPSTTGFKGVAAERLSDRLILTTQMSAGWYRYAMRWTFHLDGRIEPWFGFAATSASCISYDHTHHNYWRLDFDIDGAANDAIQMGATAPRPISADGPFKPFGREQKALVSPSYNYVVRDLQTRRGYRVVPGPSIPADAFAVSDSWAFQYKPNEVDDAGQGGGCSLNFNNFLNQEAVDDQDVVLWVRGGQFHQGGDQDDCGVARFVLEPFGNWSP